MTKEEIERQVIERQMNSYWWGQFMIPGHADYHEPWQWREALGIRGLYALIGGQEILYIGKATCIGTRIRTHRRDKWMPFSGWSYQDFSDLTARELANLEAEIIKELDPILNLRCTGYLIRCFAIVGKLHLRSLGKLPSQDPS